MKKSKITKKIIAMLLLVAMLTISFARTSSAFFIDIDAVMEYAREQSELQPVQPAPGQDNPYAELERQLSEELNLAYNNVDKKTFSQLHLLVLYSYSHLFRIDLFKDDYLKTLGKTMSEAELAENDAIISTYTPNTGVSEGKIDEADALAILNLTSVCYDSEGESEDEEKTRISLEQAKKFISKPIANELGIDEDDIDEAIKLKITHKFPYTSFAFYAERKGVEIDEDEYSDIFGDSSNNTFVVDENTTLEEYNRKTDIYEEKMRAIFGQSNHFYDVDILRCWYTSTQAIVTTDTERITYDLVLGDDINWYLVPSEREDLTFRTELTYEGDGKVEDGTFKPKYYENFEHPTGDTEVIAKITSKTEEDIVKIKIGDKVIDMKEDGTANEEDWYYPDTTNKRVIAKKYVIKTVDNIDNCGKIEETVGLIGSLGGEDTQKPSIEWTIRYLTEETTTNPDNSRTVVLTTNLPIDGDSIPDGWSPIYDEDGKTIHKITITIPAKKGYDKDVPVDQLRHDGKKVTITTHVTVEPKELSKTGESFILSAIAIGIAIFMITRFRRFKNTNK